MEQDVIPRATALRVVCNDCERSFLVDLVGLGPETLITCPYCKDEFSIGSDQLESLYQHYSAAFRRLSLDAEIISHPDHADILARAEEGVRRIEAGKVNPVKRAVVKPLLN
jgi:hypothetical protein